MIPMAAGTCLLTLALLADVQPPAPAPDRPKRPPLTAEETAFPKRVAGKLCHDAIGFTIDDPGPGFRERTDLGGGGGHVRLWLWENDQTRERLDIMVLKGTGATPEDFRQYVSGMWKGQAEESWIDEQNVDTAHRPYVANLNYHPDDGRSFATRCIGMKAERGTPWTLCAMTVAREHATLRALRESLAAGSCPR
jgi:hypothetical protein